MDPLTAAAIALQVGSTAASFFQKPKRVNVPDISAELARIRAFYDTARQTTAANIKANAGEQRGQAASNLAARGIYSSPVSENVFGRLRDAMSRDLATADANIGIQEADASSRALAALLGAQQNAEAMRVQQDNERMATLYGGLTATGSTLLNYSLNRPGASRPGATPMSGAGNFTPTMAQSYGYPQKYDIQALNRLFSTPPSPRSGNDWSFMNWRRG